MGTRLVGVSLELINDEKYLKNVRESLDTLSTLISGMQVDVTGAVTQEMAPFLTDLATSYKVTADASALLVEHAGALCTRVIGVKEVGDVRHLYIDDGCYGSLYRDWNTQEDRTPLPLLNARSSQTQSTTVWGPTCDGLDCVCRNVVLPKMSVDEWLVFPDMGLASGMGTAFNGFDPPDTAYCVLGYFRHL
jgi:ornithine decarboxylase